MNRADGSGAKFMSGFAALAHSVILHKYLEEGT